MTRQGRKTGAPRARAPEQSIRNTRKSKGWHPTGTSPSLPAPEAPALPGPRRCQALGGLVTCLVTPARRETWADCGLPEVPDLPGEPVQWPGQRPRAHLPSTAGDVASCGTPAISMTPPQLPPPPQSPRPCPALGRFWVGAPKASALRFSISGAGWRQRALPGQALL